MLTSRLAFIGMPRTGGTFFRSLLKCIPELEFWGKHGWGQHVPYRFLVERCQELGKDVPPSFVFMRNPYTYYVSAWCYHTMQSKWIVGMPFSMEFLEWHGGTPETHRWPHWTYSAMWEWMEGDAATTIWKFEDYYGGIRHILAATMGDLISDDDVRKLLAELPEKRASKLPPHGERLSGYDPKCFWDSDMRRWLEERDGALMKKQGYEL